MAAAHRPLCFVDDCGGGLAALATGVAHLLGKKDALALTTAKAVHVPPEVAAALAEIGASVPPIARLPGGAPAGTEAVDTASLGISLLPADQGDLERLSAARIARDRLERSLSHASATDSSKRQQ
ncbi:MAG: hypothetical protein U0359_41385 [Byssovorax sp.]